MNEEINKNINKIEEKISNIEKEITNLNSSIKDSLKKSNKLPYKSLYWIALVSFAILIIAGVVAAYVFFFSKFNNNVEIAICSCVIICCAFICATLLLIFTCKCLYNSKKASSQTESTKVLENAYIKYFQDKDAVAKTKTEKYKDTGNKTDTENSDANNEAKEQSINSKKDY